MNEDLKRVRVELEVMGARADPPTIRLCAVICAGCMLMAMDCWRENCFTFVGFLLGNLFSSVRAPFQNNTRAHHIIFTQQGHKAMTVSKREANVSFERTSRS